MPDTTNREDAIDKATEEAIAAVDAMIGVRSGAAYAFSQAEGAAILRQLRTYVDAQIDALEQSSAEGAQQ